MDSLDQVVRHIVDEMKPEDLNYHIAQKVMGWVPWDYSRGDIPENDKTYFIFTPYTNEGGLAVYQPKSEDISFVFAPAADIRDSMKVVEECRLSHDFGFASFHYPLLSSNGYGWIVAFAQSLRPYSLEIVSLGDPKLIFHAHSDSLPLAICRAALKASESF